MSREQTFDVQAWHTGIESALARMKGEEAGNHSADRAERATAGFKARAEAFILDHLKRRGETPGELITDLAKMRGLQPPDDRAFGPIFGKLSRRGQIVCSGFCVRRKGHGTAGGRVWRLA